DELQRDLFARVGRGVVDLAEPAAADRPLDRVAVQGAGARAEGVTALSLRVGRGHVGGPRGPVAARLLVVLTVTVLDRHHRAVVLVLVDDGFVQGVGAGKVSGSPVHRIGSPVRRPPGGSRRIASRVRVPNRPVLLMTSRPAAGSSPEAGPGTGALQYI